MKKVMEKLEPTWLPVSVDGDDEAGWVIIYQNSVSNEMRESPEVFDTEEEAQECFDNGGAMPEAFSKMMDNFLGKAPQYH